MSSQFPQLERYEGHWAVHEIMKQVLSSRRKYKAQLEASLEDPNAADADDDDDDADASDLEVTDITNLMANGDIDDSAPEDDIDHSIAALLPLPTTSIAPYHPDTPFPTFPSPPRHHPNSRPFEDSDGSAVKGDDYEDLAPPPAKKTKTAAGPKPATQRTKQRTILTTVKATKASKAPSAAGPSRPVKKVLSQRRGARQAAVGTGHEGVAV